MKKSAYAQDGVDVEAGDSLSKYAGELCRSTYKNSPFVRVRDASADNFRGPRSYRLTKLPSGVEEVVAPDGIGTKTVLHDAGNAYLCAGFDLVAMAAMDITRWGGLPLVMSNVLDLHSTSNPEAVRMLYAGLAAAADRIGMVLINGETAELGPLVGSENPHAALAFNWAGFAVGVVKPRSIINGRYLAAGQPVVALQEQGFRSNGISSVRRAFAAKFGSEWWRQPEAVPFIRKAAMESILYDRMLAMANGWGDTPRIDIAYIAHITGGGVRDKFGKDALFRHGLSAVLHHLHPLPEIMQLCAEWRGMKSKDLYATWNGGQGALVVLRHRHDVPRFIALAKEYGHSAVVCGEIIATKKGKNPSLEIRSSLNGRMIKYKA